MKIISKKYLGQYFLHDEIIVKKIVQNLSFIDYSFLIEFGPGIGVLTQYLIDLTNDLFILEIDPESIKYLHKIFPSLKSHIINMDFLKYSPTPILPSFALIGNFPYNISSQIIFYLLKYKQFIPECLCLFQTEIAERISAHYKKKIYGNLSVLIQAFYKVEYIITMPNNLFYPHPNFKIKSAIIRLYRKTDVVHKIDDYILYNIVLVAFSQRRKKLRNTLKSLNYSKNFYRIPILELRADQFSIQKFIQLSFLANLLKKIKHY